MPVNINSRTLLIIAGLALPIVALGVLTFHTKENNTSVTGLSPNAIENARQAIAKEKAGHEARLAEIEKYTDVDWPKDLVKNPHHAPTRQAAMTYQKNAIARLDHMTPQQWLAQHQQEEIRRERWEAWRKAHQAKLPAAQQHTVPSKPLPPVGR